MGFLLKDPPSWRGRGCSCFCSTADNVDNVDYRFRSIIVDFSRIVLCSVSVAILKRGYRFLYAKKGGFLNLI